MARATWEVIVGKAVPCIALASVVYLLLFALDLFVFRVRFIGSPLVLIRSHSPSVRWWAVWGTLLMPARITARCDKCRQTKQALEPE
jgi:hypothetical protein